MAPEELAAKKEKLANRTTVKADWYFLYHYAAKLGLQEAMGRLSEIFSESKDLDEQYEGVFWMMRSAADGLPSSMASVGRLILRGNADHGIAPNATEALHWTKKAANVGYARALMDLATRADAYGGLVSEEESLSWLRRAANEFIPEALEAMARNAKNRSTDEYVEWLRKAAPMGTDSAIISLAVALMCRNKDEDWSVALAWWNALVAVDFDSDASDHEREMVFYALALMKEDEDKGREANPKIAARMLRRAGEALMGGETGIANVVLNSVLASYPNEDQDKGEEADNAFEKAERNIDRKRRRKYMESSGRTGPKSSGPRLTALASSVYGEESAEVCLGPFAARGFAAYEHEGNIEAAKYWFKQHCKSVDDAKTRR